MTIEAAPHEPELPVRVSRYHGAADAESFGRGPVAMSSWETRLTKAFFPRRTASVSDPTSERLAVRRDAVDPWRSGWSVPWVS